MTVHLGEARGRMRRCLGLLSQASLCMGGAGGMFPEMIDVWTVTEGQDKLWT